MAVTSPTVFVSDLRHFLDLPHDVPGPARTLAEQLGFVVRAATAGPPGTWWTSALPCRRRPGHRRCPGHLTVLRADDEAPIAWSCTACGDEGTISGWQDSPYDLRHASARARLSGKPIAVSVTEEIAATLRGLMLLDPDCERVVFQTQAGERGLVLAATEEELDDLAGFVAAEANHDPNPRHQKRLDAAFNLLTDALPRAGL
jgi:hypothetical protein